MKVLITGGAGYIGSNLAALLACTREKPIVLDLRKPRIPGVIYVQGDVQRLGFPDSPLETSEHTSEIGGVVHLAALTGKQECSLHTHKAFETNVVGTMQVLDFCRQRDIPKMVFASTCGIYCDTGENFYIATKKQAETHCREYAESHGLNIVILRIANVYGGAFGYKDKLTVVHQFILKALLGEALKIEGDGKQTRDFIHVRDVCSAILRGLGLRPPWEQPPAQPRSSSTFFVGTGVETSMNELTLLIERTMLKLYNRTITIEYAPMPCYRSGEGVKVETTHSPVPGWQPNYDLEKGVEKTCLIASQAK